MKFGIVINEGPYTHQASDTALQFVKSALAKGHEIFRIFFYHDGVNNGTDLGVPPQDDRNLPKPPPLSISNCPSVNHMWN